MTNAVVTIEPAEIINMPSPSIESLVDEWANFVDVKENTLQTYCRCLKNFVVWTRDNQISTINRQSCISYRDNLLKTLSPSTARLYIAALRLFVKFLAGKGLCENFLDNFKGVKLLNDTYSRAALDVDECKEVLANMTGVNEKSLRDKCIVSLMLATGVRCCEVCRLNYGDIQRRGKKLFVKVQCKGRTGKEDITLLPQQIKGLIDSYLALRGRVADDEPLFSSCSNRNRGQRIKAATLSRIVKKILTSAGFIGSDYTAHCLRHTFASVALSEGLRTGNFGIYEISKSLHHRSVLVTERYAHWQAQFSNPVAYAVANQLF